jgi:hypothetical protein
MSASDEYLQAVGLAVWEYAGLEWNMVCVLRKIWPDYVSERYRLPQRPMASRVLKDWTATISCISDDQLRNEMSGLEAHIKTAIERRNDLFHATPATVNGEQILTRMTEQSSIHWTVEELRQLKDEFFAMRAALNILLYKEVLTTFPPVGKWADRQSP